MNDPAESEFFREFRAKVSVRADSESWRYDYKNCATLTFPAKTPEIGDLTVFDDQEELSLEVGKIYHTHFNPNFGPSFDKAANTAPAHIASETMNFIDSILSDAAVFWVLYNNEMPVMCGACPKDEMEDVPDEAVCYVWSGVYKR